MLFHKTPSLSIFFINRDDIIFVIYLFQRWKYPTDMTRPNEYGQVFEEKRDDPVSSTSAADEAVVKSLADKKKDWVAAGIISIRSDQYILIAQITSKKRTTSQPDYASPYVIQLTRVFF